MQPGATHQCLFLSENGMIFFLAFCFIPVPTKRSLPFGQNYWHKTSFVKTKLWQGQITNWKRPSPPPKWDLARRLFRWRRGSPLCLIVTAPMTHDCLWHLGLWETLGRSFPASRRSGLGHICLDPLASTWKCSCCLYSLSMFFHFSNFTFNCTK